MQFRCFRYLGVLSRQPARVATAGAIVAIAILAQGCSSSRGASEARLGGEEQSRTTQGQAGQGTWQQPSRFDSDGPGQQATYRGGRDPVSGRAQEWPPAAPPQPAPTHSAALPPLPPAQHSYGQPPHDQQHYPSRQAHRPYAASPPPAPLPPPPAYAQAAEPPREVASGGNSIEVRQGDTLYRISRAYGVTVPALMQANNLPNETIRPGQRLTIPPR